MSLQYGYDLARNLKPDPNLSGYLATRTVSAPANTPEARRRAFRTSVQKKDAAQIVAPRHWGSRTIASGYFAIALSITTFV